MPTVEFSQRDILRSVLLSPGWYRVRVDTIGEKTSSKGDSKNYPVEATVVADENGYTGDKDNPIAGVPLDWNFNSKAIGFALGFLKALGKDVEPGERVQLEAAEGNELMVMVSRGEYNGAEKNQVDHKYRPVE